jgi:hypothetical protein
MGEKCMEVIGWGVCILVCIGVVIGRNEMGGALCIIGGYV